jgi:hypothetical protein
MLRWARSRGRSSWDLWARWRVRSLDIPQGPRSRIPGDWGGPHRDLGRGVLHNPALEAKRLAPESRRPPRQVRPRLSNLPRRFPGRRPRRLFRDLNEKRWPLDRRPLQKNLVPSGKSPAYVQHRRNLEPAPGNRSRAFCIGLFQSDGGRIQAAAFRPPHHDRSDVSVVIFHGDVLAGVVGHHRRRH